MAEFEVLDRDEANAFSERMVAIGREESSSRRALLTDSLVLDVSKRVAELRQAEVAMAALRSASAALAVSTTERAAELRARLDRAVESRLTAQAEALAAEARALVEAEERAAAAAARRRAVLGALSSLGSRTAGSFCASLGTAIMGWSLVRRQTSVVCNSGLWGRTGPACRERLGATQTRRQSGAAISSD
jgi:hypothetical protein